MQFAASVRICSGATSRTTPITIAWSGRLFGRSHEEMKRKDGLYDICLVLDWNVTARARNRGSAIFFHLIRPGYEPTAGCVAVHPRDMQRLLPFMHRGTVVRVL